MAFKCVLCENCVLVHYYKADIIYSPLTLTLLLKPILGYPLRGV